jgi:hypothetical protein
MSSDVVDFLKIKKGRGGGVPEVSPSRCSPETHKKTNRTSSSLSSPSRVWTELESGLSGVTLFSHSTLVERVVLQRLIALKTSDFETLAPFLNTQNQTFQY